MPDTIVDISGGFEDFTALTCLVFPDTLEEIGCKAAFYGYALRQRSHRPTVNSSTV